jgi:hypothetical protein
MAKKRKKRRRRSGGGGGKKGGVMMGMRSGFKNVAGSVTGTGKPKAKKKESWQSIALTIAVVIAAIVFFYYRR